MPSRLHRYSTSEAALDLLLAAVLKYRSTALHHVCRPSAIESQACRVRRIAGSSRQTSQQTTNQEQHMSQKRVEWGASSCFMFAPRRSGPIRAEGPWQAEKAESRKVGSGAELYTSWRARSPRETDSDLRQPHSNDSRPKHERHGLPMTILVRC